MWRHPPTLTWAHACSIPASPLATDTVERGHADLRQSSAIGRLKYEDTCAHTHVQSIGLGDLDCVGSSEHAELIRNA